MDYYAYFSRYFFSDWIMMGITVAAFVVSIIFRKGDKRLRYITYYIIIALINDSLCVYSELFVMNTRLKRRILSITVSIFLLIEVTIFFIYLYQNISNRKMKNVTIMLLSFFFIFSYLAIGNSTFYYMSISWADALESLCLIIPCLFYFFELFKFPEIAFKKKESFWVITGILFYMSASIPIFLLSDYIKKNIPAYFDIVFSLNYILYSILFLLFIKAYLCRRKAISY